MKMLRIIPLLGVTISVAFSSNAYAQSGGTLAASEVVAPLPTKDGQTSVRKADRKLSSDVRRALSKTREIEMTNVFVRARSGAVTLTGSVPESAQIARAEETAKGVPGVTSVVNKLAMNAQNY